MNDKTPEQHVPMPQQTIEAIAKSFYREATGYGFRRQDYLRYVNILLDLGLETSGTYHPPNHVQPKPIQKPSDEVLAAVVVRPYKSSDFKMLKKWVDDPMGRLFLSSMPGVKRDLKELVHDPLSVFGIVSLNGKAIGALAFLNIDRESGKAELRKLIGDPIARGHGYARIATKYWIEHGISTLGLRKIYVNTLDTNLTNIRLNEELGMRVEGLLRDEICIDDGYRDILRMSLIVPD
ncbi:MAG TPA: N-acetyltransferase [Bacteroidetes bacterium]|nr:spermidine N(1)-acetyltransferase [bacterium BMS3Bbin04]HDO64810.1 N-acetyltransferase [Bacteroidota bacterium]HEX03935.1 N-acetyltransferase [Bacteroidota bacterium]